MLSKDQLHLVLRPRGATFCYSVARGMSLVFFGRAWSPHCTAHFSRNRGPSAAFIPGDLCTCSDLARSFECILMVAGSALPFLFFAGLSPLISPCFCLLYHHTCQLPFASCFRFAKWPMFPFIPQLRLLQQPAIALACHRKGFFISIWSHLP